MPTPDHGLPPDLEHGYRRFRATRYALERDWYRELGEGDQRPATMIVACSDSRSGPETIFDARPGELFVVRNVAAVVPVFAPDGRSHATSAALEYAVLALEVSTIVVMGHGRCGGIRAALAETSPLSATDFIGTWVAGIRELVPDMGPADMDDVDDADRRRLALEHRSIERSVENLRTFPWIRSRERDGGLRLAGAWFDIRLGALHALTPGGWERVPVG